MRFKFYAVWLSLICIALFIVQVVLGGFTELLLLNGSAFEQPWRFLTAIFLHGDLVHLVYNLFALLLFGSILEKLIGGNRFLVVFFISGLFANLLSVFFYDSSLGASGAIFGVIGALIAVRPMLIVFAFGLPMPIFIAGILWVAGDLIGLFIPSNVANLAHLAGVAFGLILGLLFKPANEYHRRSNNLSFNEHSVRQWEDRYLR